MNCEMESVSTNKNDIFFGGMVNTKSGVNGAEDLIFRINRITSNELTYLIKHHCKRWSLASDNQLY